MWPEAAAIVLLSAVVGATHRPEVQRARLGEPVDLRWWVGGRDTASNCTFVPRYGNESRAISVVQTERLPPRFLENPFGERVALNSAYAGFLEFKFARAEMSDSGDYKCVTSFADGYAIVHTVRLRVRPAADPRLTKSKSFPVSWTEERARVPEDGPDVVTARVGDQAVMRWWVPLKNGGDLYAADCQFTPHGYASPARLFAIARYWDGRQEFSPSDPFQGRAKIVYPPDLEGDDFMVFSIERVRRRDAGKYTCVTQSLGKVAAAWSQTLYVRGARPAG